VDGAIVIAHKHHQQEFSDYFSQLGLRIMDKDSSGRYRKLEEWVGDLNTGSHDTVFYLAGYSPAVGKLQKLLKGKGYGSHEIMARGFWD
jgi:hypothetical protein